MNAPLVSVIVTTHLDENAPYLKLCLDSLLASEGVDFEVIVVSDTDRPPALPAGKAFRLCHDKKLKLAGTKFNHAIKHLCHPQAKYLWLISDDVMVSKHAMLSMVHGMGENQIICNPMANGDNGTQYYTDLGVPLKLSYQDIVSGPHAYLEFAAATNRTAKPFLIRVPQFVAFYCTMMPRTVWDKVGEIDVRLDYRHNDQDYCLRAWQLGFPSMINLGAFAIHFGDKTIPKCVTTEELDECTRVFTEKYSVQR